MKDLKLRYLGQHSTSGPTAKQDGSQNPLPEVLSLKGFMLYHLWITGRNYKGCIPIQGHYMSSIRSLKGFEWALHWVKFIFHQKIVIHGTASVATRVGLV